MEENKTWEVGIPSSSASHVSTRNYRDVVVGRKFTDRVSLLLQEQVASSFVVSISNLSSDEIMQRKRRAAQGSLSAEESAEKSGLQQGSACQRLNGAPLSGLSSRRRS